jgi:hypothetical protein
MGVPVATYLQHENGSRGFTMEQNERYGIFFQGAAIMAAALKSDQGVPEPETLAGQVYDQINQARHWTDAGPEAVAAYRDGVEAVFRAYGIQLPEIAEKPAQSRRGGR